MGYRISVASKKKSGRSSVKRSPAVDQVPHAGSSVHPASVIQRALANPRSLTPSDVLYLQRTIGNAAVVHLVRGADGGADSGADTAQQPQRGTVIQSKLTVGPARDSYEAEADRVAAGVMRAIQAPAQRLPPGEENQTLGDGFPRRASLSSVQRHHQEADKDELRLKADPGQVVGPEGGEADSGLATAIQRARGRGQPLDPGVRGTMENAFGADFDGVHVHADRQSDQLNRSIQAEAFTSGRDIFFRQGAYDPGKTASQQLIAHELTHVVQQTGGQSVQRRTDGEGIEVQGRLPANRISTKRRLTYLDFVLMKRQKADFGKIVGKKLGIKGNKKKQGNDDDNGGSGLYGHYWTEIGNRKNDQFTPTESYGWWPKGEDAPGARGAILGVEGELNGGNTNDRDPHQGDAADIAFHPAMEVDSDAESYDSIRNRVVTEIRDFSHAFKGSWNWRFGWGKNCQTFQDRLKTKVGLHYKKAKSWLIDPEIERQAAVERQAAQEQDESRQRAVAAVWRSVTFPDTGVTMAAWKEVTEPGSRHRQFKDIAGAGFRAAGKALGATGITALGSSGEGGNAELMVEFVYENNVYWMPEAWWKMYLNQPYPELT